MMKLRFLVLLFVLWAFIFVALVDAEPQDTASSQVVHVVLTEWEITIDRLSVMPGKVTFKAENRGTLGHEIVVIETGLTAETFEVVEGKVREEAVGKVMGEIEELKAGRSFELTLELSKGRYVLFCNNREKSHAEGHYQKGMRVSFTVGNAPS